jgi:hypothetical protein
MRLWERLVIESKGTRKEPQKSNIDTLLIYHLFRGTRNGERIKFAIGINTTESWFISMDAVTGRVHVYFIGSEVAVPGMKYLCQFQVQKKILKYYIYRLEVWRLPYEIYPDLWVLQDVIYNKVSMIF